MFTNKLSVPQGHSLRTGPRAAVALLATLLLVAGCGTSGGGSSTTTKGAAIKVGMILEDRPAVDPWSKAWDVALKEIAGKDSGVTYQEAYNANTPTDAQPVIQQMLNNNFGLMLLTSYTLTDIAKSLQSQFPTVPMAVSSFAGVAQPNLSVMTASYLQMGYVNCWLLTKLSKTGTIGYINGLPVPFATELLQGCKLGATAANPNAKVLTAYTNSFSNQQAAVIQAKNLASQGADAIWPASGEGDALGVYQYCEQTKTPCAGWGGTIDEWAPNTGVINATLNWVPFIQKLIAQKRSGQLEAFSYDGTYANGGIEATLRTNLVSSDLKTQFEAMLNSLKSGTIALPASTAHPGLP